MWLYHFCFIAFTSFCNHIITEHSIIVFAAVEISLVKYLSAHAQAELNIHINNYELVR